MITNLRTAWATKEGQVFKRKTTTATQTIVGLARELIRDHMLLLKRAKVWFPAPTLVAHNHRSSRSRGPDALFWLLRALAHMYHTHILLFLCVS